MACWGCRSYENELTMDRVALPAGCYELSEDEGQMRLSEDGRAWAHVLISDAAWRDPGVVVLMVEMGAKRIPTGHVRSALRLILQDQTEYYNAPSCPFEEDLWWRALQTDIDVLRRHLAAAATASPLRIKQHASCAEMREGVSVDTCVM